ncbi:M56 family metallopeptidase [Rheinheimera sp. MMS21-TC3]|uniref:M56 family metallopeptidase n=1 Tax=Rheinheimera sp. MMS21-TC3 TaxID=3072790 RepID=UPI0028C3BAFD|nr:M56 family metallopeptidase [Rheinheimera sp. MMS21-TC3]WNO60768.1 M56 family metallopeptidase [Rheinheimera sp. MMS21-TC3]
MTEYLLYLMLPLSLLLLLLMIVQHFFMAKLGARTIYALWSSVPLLLLLSVISPLLQNFIPAFASAAPFQHYQVGVQQLTVTANNTNWLFVLWLTGALLGLGYLFLSYLYSLVIFRRATPVLVKSVKLVCYQSDTKDGPYISGFFKPSILLPQDFFTRFSDLQQQLIVRHELTHWQRGDIYLNCIALVVLCLFWFNPLCYLAYRQYRQVQELACDAQVTANASHDERIAYGYALLSSAQQSVNLTWPLTHHYGDFKIMKQRITQLQFQRGVSKSIVLSVIAIVVIASLFIQQPAQATGVKTPSLAPVTRIEPRYPLQAAKEGITGFVQFEFDVDAKGNVINAKVLKAIPSNVFEKEALNALQQWQYTATGKLHKSQRVQLNFELDVIKSDMERISVTPPAPPVPPAPVAPPVAPEKNM